MDKRGPYLTSMGSIPMLAKEVGDRWKAGELARIEAERSQRFVEFRRLSESVLDLREQLHRAWQQFQRITPVETRTLL